MLLVGGRIFVLKSPGEIAGGFNVKDPEEIKDLLNGRLGDIFLIIPCEKVVHVIDGLDRADDIFRDVLGTVSPKIGLESFSRHHAGIIVFYEVNEEIDIALETIDLGSDRLMKNIREPGDIEFTLCLESGRVEFFNDLFLSEKVTAT